jgi:hypothetical protein
VTDALGREQLFSSTVRVTDAVPPQPRVTIGPPSLIVAGKQAELALSGSGALSYDLDGDGQFDDGGSANPNTKLDVTLTGPKTVAVKATSDGLSTIASVALEPVAGTLTPAPYALLESNTTGDPWPVGGHDLWFVADHRGGAATIDGVPSTTGTSFTLPAGDHTLQADALDNGVAASFRETLHVGTAPPAVAISVHDGVATASASDPEGHGVASYAWDLDADGDFDDASGPATGFTDDGRLIGVAVTDADGDIGIKYVDPRTVTVTPPPPVSAPAPAPKPPAKAAPSKLTLTLKTPKLASLLAHGLKVKVGCGCRATMTLKRSGRTLARKTGKGTITLKLSASARRALKKLHKATLTLTVSATGRKTVKRTLTIRR